MTVKYGELGLELLASGVEGAEWEDEIRFTPRALEVMKEVEDSNDIPEGYRLRIGLRGGGETGKEFFMEYDAEQSDYDREYEINTVEIVIDARSLFYMMGKKVDYIAGEEGRGFILEDMREGVAMSRYREVVPKEEDAYDDDMFFERD